MLLDWIQRYLGALVAGLGLLLAGALVLIVLLFVQAGQTRDDLHRLEAELERVESSAALVALRLETFRAQLESLAPVLSAGLDEAIAGLESFRSETLEFSIAIDQQLDVEAEVPIDYEIVVPIEATVPIRETLRTTIQVQGPLGIDVPVNVEVPIDLEVPVSTEVVVPLRETLPLRTTVPVALDLPVRLELGQAGLASATDALLELLVELRAALAGLGG